MSDQQENHYEIFGLIIFFAYLKSPIEVKPSKLMAYYSIWTHPDSKEGILKHTKQIDVGLFRKLLLLSNKLEYFSFYCDMYLNPNDYPELPIPIHFKQKTYYHLNLICPIYKYPSPIFSIKKSITSKCKSIYLDKDFKVFQKNLLQPEFFSNDIVSYSINVQNHFFVFEQSKLVLSENIQVKSSDLTNEYQTLTVHFVFNIGFYNNKIKNLVIVFCQVIQNLLQNVYLESSGSILYLLDFDICSGYKRIDNIVFLNPSVFLERRFPYLNEQIYELKNLNLNLLKTLELIHYRSGMYFLIYKSIKHYISDFYMFETNTYRKMNLFEVLQSTTGYQNSEPKLKNYSQYIFYLFSEFEQLLPIDNQTDFKNIFLNFIQTMVLQSNH